MPDDANGRNSAQYPAPAVPVVLVIDDDPAMLHSLASLFEARGIAISATRDGLAGLAAFRWISPTVVLTDILMPEKEGLETIMGMRRERPGVKILAMSGAGRIGNSDFLTIAKKLGADAMVHKPFDVDVAKHVKARRRTDQRRSPGPGPSNPTLPCGSPPAASPRIPKRRLVSCRTNRPQNLLHPGRRHRRTNAQRHARDGKLHDTAGLHAIERNHGKRRTRRVHRLLPRLAHCLPAPGKNLLWRKSMGSRDRRDVRPGLTRRRYDPLLRRRRPLPP
jgi:DNA-binding response OmpR family regulator